MKIIRRVGIKKSGEVSLQDLIKYIRKNENFDKCGAIATFTGIVKGYTKDGKKVEKIEIQAYEELAIKSLEKISEELRSKPGIVDVLIYHLIGTFSVGEILVYVVVAGISRGVVFSTLKEAVKRYKSEAALWKKEFLVNGEAYWMPKNSKKL